ncbi:MAG TPA: keto-deoxy-phosphogluconate aldolase, partial [Beijerinckiaceae bacterium]|nr:keto-deoxy-phosphogluconate aldolase [Beijerinckiaceae bacterium]
LTLREAGFRALKFFPAVAAGGLEYLKSVAGPCPDLKFCPTGGIGPGNMRAFLAEPNICAVGGSWLTPKAAMQNGDFAAITRLAAEATG